MVKKHKSLDIDYNANFPSNLAAAASNDMLQKWMQYIYFHNGYAWATNAHCLIRQPFSLINIKGIENMEGHALHSIAFAKIIREKSSIVMATKTGITVDCIDQYFWECYAHSQEADYFHETYLNYSYSFNYSNIDQKNAENMEQVLNQAMENINSAVNYNSFSFSTTILNTLQKSMLLSGYGIIMKMPVENNLPFVITDRDDALKDQIGMIMPIKLTDNNF